jgi:hypothetical protein
MGISGAAALDQKRDGPSPSPADMRRLVMAIAP